MNQTFKYHILSSFWIKVVALFLMTLDHVAKFMQFAEISPQIAAILEIIGRLGFPLFILLLAEGVRHTSNFGKYILRLGILAVTVLVAQVVIHYCFFDMTGFYSPIIDLVLCAATMYFLKQKNRKSFFAIIPIAYIILSFIVMCLEEQNGSLQILWFPFYLRSGYNIFALLLSLGFFYAYPLAKVMIRNFGNSAANLEDTPYERLLVNTLMCFVVLFSVLVVYLIALFPGGDIYTIAHESYAILAVVFIFLYNEKLGYNKKWFKYGAYIYFPLHIIIIFIIFFICGGITL